MVKEDKRIRYVADCCSRMYATREEAEKHEKECLVGKKNCAYVEQMIVIYADDLEEINKAHRHVDEDGIVNCNNAFKHYQAFEIIIGGYKCDDNHPIIEMFVQTSGTDQEVLVLGCGKEDCDYARYGLHIGKYRELSQYYQLYHHYRLTQIEKSTVFRGFIGDNSEI